MSRPHHDESRRSMIHQELDAYLSSRKKPEPEHGFSIKKHIAGIFSAISKREQDIDEEFSSYGEDIVASDSSSSAQPVKGNEKDNEKKGWSLFFRKKNVEERPEEKEFVGEKFDEQGNILQSSDDLNSSIMNTNLEKEFRDYDADVRELKQKQGVFARIFSVFSGPEEYAEMPPAETLKLDSSPLPEVTDLRSDIREVGRIAISAMRRIPNKELLEFKESDEFLRFKELLKKHNIIK